MKITNIETFSVSVPLKKPFKTALRTVTNAEAIIVKITAGEYVGYGEAPPTVVITGESLASIDSAIQHVVKPKLVGMDLTEYESVMYTLQKSMIGNTSAKAAVDMAIYDLLAKRSQLPLYQFLGGYRNALETDYTVSVNEPVEMATDAVQYIKDGFSILKVKVGKDTIQNDLSRIKEIRKRVQNDAVIRLDANQGWTAKEAIYAIRKMEDEGLNIELVEQPVHAKDIEGLRKVTDAVYTPIMADESVFSPEDALKVIITRASDLINIKLMKSGGIHQALKINALAESAGIECMVGSMIESRVGITAAAHLAASQRNITRFDFDAPLMLDYDLVNGGVQYTKNMMTFTEDYGLGIHYVEKGGITVGMD
ncbi:dipeptide epimerase [Alkalihalobacillus hwajinpoensis]|uniref:dipeptide epimerase n=1 Tax=Guptibacillus hwajinpoensis TaxID=208199 RepID=UPI00188444AC|nr:dipeptide epimerase [Pseudalkalibacillus hwajinpoensis]MBF0708642.1 dipeptide epimerase [Pseudalkalibacillus hwajinpoensis]